MVTVIVASRGSAEGGRPAPATVTVTNLRNSAAEEHRVVGRTSLELPPGRYSLQAKTANAASDPAPVAVKSGDAQEVTLLLKAG